MGVSTSKRLSIFPARKRTNTKWFHLPEVPRVLKVMETECRVVVVKDREEGRVKSCLAGAKFQFGKIKNILGMDGAMV